MLTKRASWIGLAVSTTLVFMFFLIWKSQYIVKSTSSKFVPAKLVGRSERMSLLLPCRVQPLRIAPNPGLENAVTEDDMVCVLCGALPWWNPPTVPTAIHELRLWGRDAVFTREMFDVDRSGEFLVTTLLSDKACRANTTKNGGSFLLDSPFGIRVVLMGTQDATENRSEAHLGQLLQVLGEAGVPSTTSVTTSSGRVGSVAELYQDAVLRFSLIQELEFIGLALVYWQPPEKSWIDQFGTGCDFDELVSKLIVSPLGRGSCGGCHVPFTVVNILRRQRGLSYPVRRCQEGNAGLAVESDQTSRKPAMHSGGLG